jgi:hypothetical protein
MCRGRDVTAIIINLWIDHLATVRLHLRERALLVDAHLPTVADNVSREDRRKSPLYAVVWHACSNFLDQAIVIREHLAGRLVAYDQKADLFVPRLRCLLGKFALPPKWTSRNPSVQSSSPNNLSLLSF